MSIYLKWVVSKVVTGDFLKLQLRLELLYNLRNQVMMGTPSQLLTC